MHDVCTQKHLKPSNPRLTRASESQKTGFESLTIVNTSPPARYWGHGINYIYHMLRRQIVAREYLASSTHCAGKVDATGLNGATRS
jgi:hypothetical protein